MNIISNHMTPYRLPKRDRNSHKGLFGHIVVIGGNLGMSGAPRITAAAALRAGAGRVTLITRPEHAALANITFPELMCLGVESSLDIPTEFESASIFAVGPGLAQDAWAENMMQYALSKQTPLVIDADGLNYLAKHKTKRNNWILTPHPGEAARLLNTKTTHIQADRLKAVNELQQNYGGVSILKGAGTLVAAENEPTHLFDQVGNPGMASPGMGDCLTGIIAALVGQHLSLSDAARLGVWVHAKAGDMAAQKGGERGLLASDLLPFIRELLNND